MGHGKDNGWDWIVEFYARPEVKSACLVLQERHQVDVTFLLFLCWLDARGETLKEHYLTLHQNTEGIRKKIRLIRKLRRLASNTLLLKNLKEGLLSWELRKERDFFRMLCREEILDDKPGGLQARNYITYQGAFRSAAARVILRELGV